MQLAQAASASSPEATGRAEDAEMKRKAERVKKINPKADILLVKIVEKLE